MSLVKLNARSATALDATVLTGNLPAISGSSLTGITTGALLIGSKTANGSTGNGSGVDMMTSDAINLSSYENKHLIVYGQTAISENANTGNASIIRIQLNNGSSTTTLSASRQGHGVYSDVAQDRNSIVHISAFAVYQIASAYATTCTIRLNGGIDSGDFTYGNQGDYNHFDGEGAGIGMRYFVI